MLIPRYVQGRMILTDNSAFEIQNRIQQGCSCCGFAGDPFLIVRAIPAKYGRGFAVLFQEPGSPPCILYRTDTMQEFDDKIDHRAITYLAEARKNWEQKQTHAGLQDFIRKMEAHDAKVQRDTDRQEIDMSIEVSKMVGSHLRKEGKVSKKHKIDRRKD